MRALYIALFAGALVLAAFMVVRTQSGAAAVEAVAPPVMTTSGPEMVVYRNAGCGCCIRWAEYLRASGMRVSVQDVEDLPAVRERLGVPRELTSCHTGVVDGYVVEGHVPAADIRRLLAERPALAGIAVAGMPLGSPGMESPNPQPYDVIAFTSEGEQAVFARR